MFSPTLGMHEILQTALMTMQWQGHRFWVFLSIQIWGNFSLRWWACGPSLHRWGTEKVHKSLDKDQRSTILYISTKHVLQLCTDEQKQQCVLVCQKLCEVKWDQNCLLRDRTWVYCYIPDQTAVLSVETPILSMSVGKEHTVKALLIMSLFLWPKLLTSIATRRLCSAWGSKFTENIWNSGGTKTGWWTMTVLWGLLLCQCSNFWPLIAWLWSPPSLLTWLGPL